MKCVRFVLTGTVLLASCGVLASHSWAQRGGGLPEVATCCVTTVCGPATVLPSPKEAELHIRHELEAPVNFDFVETPLADVLNFIKDNHDLQIDLDSKTLTDAGIDATTTPITSSFKGVKLRSALNRILSAIGLTWIIRDELMLITTRGIADTTFETRLYDVQDLTSNDRDPNGPPDFDSLIKTIVATVKGNWQESGGRATIREFSNNGIRAIAVAQTYDGHEQIEALLAELRKLRPQR